MYNSAIICIEWEKLLFLLFSAGKIFSILSNNYGLLNYNLFYGQAVCVAVSLQLYIKCFTLK